MSKTNIHSVFFHEQILVVMNTHIQGLIARAFMYSSAYQIHCAVDWDHLLGYVLRNNTSSSSLPEPSGL